MPEQSKKNMLLLSGILHFYLFKHFHLGCIRCVLIG
jgi:hypothetical protein